MKRTTKRCRHRPTEIYHKLPYCKGCYARMLEGDAKLKKEISGGGVNESFNR